jgi:hypothetical protein
LNLTWLLRGIGVSSFGSWLRAKELEVRFKSSTQSIPHFTDVFFRLLHDGDDLRAGAPGIRPLA